MHFDMWKAGGELEVTNPPPWFPEVDDEDKPHDLTYQIVPLTALADKFVSRKHRSDLEKLDAEEKFAMSQWIDQMWRQERRLHRYDILTVVAAEGCLCPKEPLKADPSDTGNELWLEDGSYDLPETAWDEDG